MFSVEHLRNLRRKVGLNPANSRRTEQPRDGLNRQCRRITAKHACGDGFRCGTINSVRPSVSAARFTLGPAASVAQLRRARLPPRSADEHRDSPSVAGKSFDSSFLSLQSKSPPCRFSLKSLTTRPTFVGWCCEKTLSSDAVPNAICESLRGASPGSTAASR